MFRRAFRSEHWSEHRTLNTCLPNTEQCSGPTLGQKLTRDHKPELPQERTRIQKAGGQVVFDGFAKHRVYYYLGPLGAIIEKLSM